MTPSWPMAYGVGRSNRFGAAQRISRRTWRWRRTTATLTGPGLRHEVPAVSPTAARWRRPPRNSCACAAATKIKMGRSPQPGWPGQRRGRSRLGRGGLCARMAHAERPVTAYSMSDDSAATALSLAGWAPISWRSSMSAS
jgi:hypothetical protein